MTDLKFEDSLARLRPSHVCGGAEGVGAAAAAVLPRACAGGQVPSSSPIDGDVPARDAADFRRGRLTNHKVFGDAIAILAGVALLTLAFKLVAENAALVPDARVICDVVAEIADAAGTGGMVAGPVVDIESEGKAVTPPPPQH